MYYKAFLDKAQYGLLETALIIAKDSMSKKLQEILFNIWRGQRKW